MKEPAPKLLNIIHGKKYPNNYHKKDYNPFPEGGFQSLPRIPYPKNDENTSTQGSGEGEQDSRPEHKDG